MRRRENRLFRLIAPSPYRPIVAAMMFIAACVPLPPEMRPQDPKATTSAASTFPDIEPNGTSITSLHFTLRGYSESELRNIANQAEDIYNKIGIDSGLYSYLAGQAFTLVVYKDSSEYETKTKLAGRSRAVIAGSTLYTYAGPDLDPALTHHLTHLIFNTYMSSRASSLTWLGEGLAMHEEILRKSESQRISLQTAQSNKLRNGKMPFSQMTFMVGTNEEGRWEEAWYLQTESVVSFLMRHGSPLTFTAFLNALRNGADLESAISNVYGAKFRDLPDFEMRWGSNI